MTTRIQTDLSDIRWLDVYNDSDQVIRPFAAVEIAQAKFPVEWNLPNTLTRCVFRGGLPQSTLIVWTTEVNGVGISRSFCRGGNEFGFNSELAILPGCAGKVTLQCPTFALVHDQTLGGFGYDGLAIPVSGQQWLEHHGTPNSNFNPLTGVDFVGIYQLIAKIPERIIPRVCGDAEIWLVNHASRTENIT